MSDNKNTMLMEVFFKHVGEAHIENLVNDLETHREEIDKIVIPKSFDDWFWKFSASKKKEERRKAAFKQLRYITAKVAVVAIVLLASLSIVTLSVKSVRAKIFDFFTNIFEQFSEVKTKIDFNNYAMKDINWESYYYPTYLPDGYEYKSNETFGTLKIIEFVKGIDLILSFNQTNTLGSIRFDTENAVVTNVSIKGNNGIIAVKDNRAFLIWNDGVTYFYLSGQVNDSDMIRIANSLEIVENK
jgi:hypothetical protein